MPDPAADQDQPTQERQDFLREMVREDLATGRVAEVVTRFPPEPNGYLHIGHAKAICLNFGIAREFGGRCNLRMDDTNPVKEDVEYVDSIMEDVKWLIAGWADHCLGLKPVGRLPKKSDVKGHEDFYLAPIMAAQNQGEALEPFYASDYFEPLYDYALELIRKGKAFVCDHTPEEVDQMRGAPDRPGQASAYRDRSVAESLDLFQRMRAGEFPDAARTLRAKIDMRSPNLWLRDPVLYRIRHASHHHTGDDWCIYPMYDFAHGLSDYIEGVTHSLCTLEFEVHRPLYEWILEALELPRTHPRQREFARLNVTYTVMSKRRLLAPCGGGARPGLGRPAHAHHLGHAPARLSGRGDPRFLRAHRSRKAREHGRSGAAGTFRTRRPEPTRPAGHGGAATSPRGDRELPRGPGRGDGGRQQP